MKVLIISNNFPNGAEPVRGIFIYQIVKALMEKCDVEVVAPLPWIPKFVVKRLSLNYPFAYVPSEEFIGGIRVYHPRYLVIPKVLGFMHGIFLFVPLFRLIKRLERKQKLDVLNAHWIFPDGFATAWAGKILKKPTVLTGLGCDLNYYPSLPFRKLFIKKALNLADIVTTVGKELKEPVFGLGISKEKVCAIPNGVDFKRFNVIPREEARRRLQIENSGPLLVTVSSLDEAKGGRYLIQAIKEMGHDFDDAARLLMVGDGPLRKDLLLQTKQLGIANKVVLLGKRPHHEIPLWMNAADLFCLPSIREGQPNVILEALACGTPVVASNVGSIPEMIQTENGRIAEAANSKSLAHQILYCLDREWDRMAIRNSIPKFTWEDSAELYMQAYLRAMGRGKSA